MLARSAPEHVLVLSCLLLLLILILLLLVILPCHLLLLFTSTLVTNKSYAVS